MKQQSLIQALQIIVGKKNIALKKSATEYYRQGFRSGGGEALAVVFPKTLLQLWETINACAEADTIIIMQAANTGLTEGSTPNAEDYDRDIVIINTLGIGQLIVLDNGKQIISLPGSTLHTLEKTLKPYQRSPHSVIGSSCLGASIVGGIANNSGGALVKRGPAYTELSLYIQINTEGKVELVNELGIELGETPEEIINNLENETFRKSDIKYPEKLASDKEYTQRIRDIHADTPARYNADKRRLYGASGCAGKVAVLAVRLDTFPIPEKETVFYIGTNNPSELTKLRQDILSHFKHLPEVAEYMHRDIFTISEKYGKDTFMMINYLGTDKLPKLFALKGRITATLNKIPLLPRDLPDKIMQWVSVCFPQHLPARMIAFRDQYEHHLILKMSDEGINEAKNYFLSNQSLSSDKNTSDYFICSEQEAKQALLHRFAAAGAAVRYETMHQQEVEDILALDIALRRNDEEWVETLPKEINESILHKLYYGHFMCHVFHQDYIVKKGENITKIKQSMLELLSKKGAKYPAEHNVGHLYKAEKELKDFYEQLDPTNTFNPGIGKTSKIKRCC